MPEYVIDVVVVGDCDSVVVTDNVYGFDVALGLFVVVIELV